MSQSCLVVSLVPSYQRLWHKAGTPVSYSLFDTHAYNSLTDIQPSKGLSHHTEDAHSCLAPVGFRLLYKALKIYSLECPYNLT